jgi:polyisoprenoid-binding protein YceI
VRRPLGVLALTLGLAAAAHAEDWRVARGDVRVICPLTVGGSFEAKTSALTGALTRAAGHPAAFEGALTVDLGTLATGIDLRDKHMRETYLEVGKGEGYASAVLSDLDLGATPAESIRGKVRFTASLLLHGTKKPVAGQAEVRREGTQARVDATFPVTLADYGIKEPRYLGVGVGEVVQVKVTLMATPGTQAAAR